MRTIITVSVALCVITLGVSAKVDTSSVVNVVRLAELEERFGNGKDTTFVVNFWATWCKPCIAELPAFDKLARLLKGQAVKVLLISLDDPKERTTKVDPFIRKKGYLPEVVLLNEAKPHEWINKVDTSWSGAIPATLLIHSNSGRRVFYEQEFDAETLQTTVLTFIKSTL